MRFYWYVIAVASLLAIALFLSGAVRVAQLREESYDLAGPESTPSNNGRMMEQLPMSKTPLGREAADSTGWPRDFRSNGKQFMVFQPSLKRLTDDTFQVRALVSVQGSPTATPVFGVVWMTARTDVDESTQLLTLKDARVTKVSIPAASGQERGFLTSIAARAPEILRLVLDDSPRLSGVRKER